MTGRVPPVPPDLGHAEWLRRMANEGDPPPVTRETAGWAWTAWAAVRNVSGGRMPVPSASVGADGRVFYRWDREAHHLELQFFAGRPAEWWYADRQTSRRREGLCPLLPQLPGALLTLLLLFYCEDRHAELSD